MLKIESRKSWRKKRERENVREKAEEKNEKTDLGKDRLWKPKENEKTLESKKSEKLDKNREREEFIQKFRNWQMKLYKIMFEKEKTEVKIINSLKCLKEFPASERYVADQ